MGDSEEEVGHFVKSYYMGSFHLRVYRNKQEPHEFRLKIGTYSDGSSTEVGVEIQEDELGELISVLKLPHQNE